MTNSVVLMPPAPAEVQEKAAEAMKALPEALAAAPGTVKRPKTPKPSTDKHQIPDCCNNVVLMLLQRQKAGQ